MKACLLQQHLSNLTWLTELERMNIKNHYLAENQFLPLRVKQPCSSVKDLFSSNSTWCHAFLSGAFRSVYFLLSWRDWSCHFSSGEMECGVDSLMMAESLGVEEVEGWWFRSPLWSQLGPGPSSSHCSASETLHHPLASRHKSKRCRQKRTVTIVAEVQVFN